MDYQDPDNHDAEATNNLCNEALLADTLEISVYRLCRFIEQGYSVNDAAEKALNSFDH